MDKKIEKIFSFSKTIAFELVALSTHFYQERTVVIGSQCVKKHFQDFRYYYDRSFQTEAPSGWPKKITNLLPWRFGQCLGRFNMLTVHMCFNTGLFRNSNNHAFCSVLFRKNIRYEVHFFFKMLEMLCRFEKRKKNIEKMFWVYEIIEFEFLAFNTPFYRERIPVIGSQ